MRQEIHLGINKFVGDNVNYDLVTFVGCMNKRNFSPIYLV